MINFQLGVKFRPRVNFRTRVKFRNRVRFRPSFIVLGGCAAGPAKILRPGGTVTSAEQILPGRYATCKVVGETVRLVACEVTWYLKYQVMLLDGRQPYNQVYASWYSSSNRIW
jgi:hypothetical protein